VREEVAVGLRVFARAPIGFFTVLAVRAHTVARPQHAATADMGLTPDVLSSVCDGDGHE
jgi:hypothetical protein